MNALKKQRKKRTAAILVSLYLLGTVFAMGLLRVYRKTYDTISSTPLPETTVTQTEDAYVFSVLHYQASVARDTLYAVHSDYKRAEPFLPCTLRMAVIGCETLLHLTE